MKKIYIEVHSKSGNGVFHRLFGTKLISLNKKCHFLIFLIYICISVGDAPFELDPYLVLKENGSDAM